MVVGINEVWYNNVMVYFKCDWVMCFVGINRLNDILVVKDYNFLFDRSFYYRENIICS